MEIQPQSRENKRQTNQRWSRSKESNPDVTARQNEKNDVHCREHGDEQSWPQFPEFYQGSSDYRSGGERNFIVGEGSRSEQSSCDQLTKVIPHRKRGKHRHPERQICIRSKRSNQTGSPKAYSNKPALSSPRVCISCWRAYHANDAVCFQNETCFISNTGAVYLKSSVLISNRSPDHEEMTARDFEMRRVLHEIQTL